MSTAKEFKDRFKAPAPIIVTVGDLTIECRRPDLVHMVFSGMLVWPALARVRELTAVAPAEGAVIDNRPQPTLVDRAQAAGSMLDEWVCMAAVVPKVVLLEHEVTDDSVWVETLPFEIRQAVFSATFRVPSTAVADFRDHESDRVAAGQDGETVRDETFVAVGPV